MTSQPEPGRELDRMVAEAMGLQVRQLWVYRSLVGVTHFYEDRPTKWAAADQNHYTIEEGKDPVLVPRYSTDIKSAMQAWEWLEDNHPWIYLDRRGTKSHLLMGKYEDKPTVFVMRSQWESSRMEGTANLAFIGKTYPHAICLAILEATKYRDRL